MNIGFLFLPIKDYIKTRRDLWQKFIISAIPAVIALIYSYVFNLRSNIDISKVFSDFVNVQISAVAILISFSIAIITILVSSDSKNVEKLRHTSASEENYKPINKQEQLTLFQVLLSNITYNVLIEIIYLGILICQIFFQLIVPISLLKYLTAIDIFFVSHILLILIESVVRMYLTFWKNPNDKEKQNVTK